MLLILFRDPAQKIMTLLLPSTCSARTSARVGFINNHEFRALTDENITSFSFDVINAQHLKRKMLEDASVTMNFPVETCLRVGADYDGFNADFCANFLLPLVAKMGKTQDGKSTNDSAFK